MIILTFFQLFLISYILFYFFIQSEQYVLFLLKVSVIYHSINIKLSEAKWFQLWFKYPGLITIIS